MKRKNIILSFRKEQQVKREENEQERIRNIEMEEQYRADKFRQEQQAKEFEDLQHRRESVSQINQSRRGTTTQILARGNEV